MCRIHLIMNSFFACRSIVTFAKEVPLHVLVNNAGVFVVPFDHNQEGFETPVGTNYFGEAVICLPIIGEDMVLAVGEHMLVGCRPAPSLLALIGADDYMHRALLADSLAAGQPEEDCQGCGWGQVGAFPSLPSIALLSSTDTCLFKSSDQFMQVMHVLATTAVHWETGSLPLGSSDREQVMASLFERLGSVKWDDLEGYISRDSSLFKYGNSKLMVILMMRALNKRLKVAPQFLSSFAPAGWINLI